MENNIKTFHDFLAENTLNESVTSSEVSFLNDIYETFKNNGGKPILVKITDIVKVKPGEYNYEIEYLKLKKHN